MSFPRSIGDVISRRTEGRWIGFESTISSDALPGPKTILTLYELTTTRSASLTQIETWASVQDLPGSLQPIRARELSEYRETVVADYKFYISKSVFTSAANESKLIEKNQLRIGSHKYDITFVEAMTMGPLPHYKILLKEVF